MSFPLPLPDHQAAPCQSFTSKLETLQKQELKLLFGGPDFMPRRKRPLRDELEGHACQRMECDEPPSFTDMRPQGCWRQLPWRLLNPVFLGWEFDPVPSATNDTYLLDFPAWKRKKIVPSVGHCRNQTFFLFYWNKYRQFHDDSSSTKVKPN